MRADDRRVEHLHAMHPLAQGGERFEESFEYAAAAQAPEALPEALSRRRRACRHWLIAVPSAMIKISYSGYRFPPEIIQHAIWLYIRFTLSFRDVEDLLAERGIMVSYETVRRWVNHFGPMVAADLRKRRPKPHTIWRLVEGMVRVIGRGKNRLSGDDQCCFPAVVRFQAHHDDVVDLGLSGFEIAKRLADRRVTLGFQNIQGKRDIMRGQGRAVMEPCLLAQKKAVGGLVRRNPYGVRDKPIERIRLVAACAHQRIESEPHSGSAVALQNIGIQRIKGGEIEILGAEGRAGLKRDLAALRRIGIYIRKMAETGRQGEVAKDRKAMGLGLLRGRPGSGREKPRQNEASEAKAQRCAAGE